jgi:uncharacterized membrane protein
LVLLFGLTLILGHNYFDSLTPAKFGEYFAQKIGGPSERWAWLWNILHSPNLIVLSGTPEDPSTFHGIATGYTLIPWAGVMAAGYGFGPVMRREREQRVRMLVGVGLVLVVAFIALRHSNAYGDPEKWTAHLEWTEKTPDGEVAYEREGPMVGTFSFLNCQKYPPSLCYLLMTLGPSILLLAAFDRPAGPLMSILVTYGRVPLFFYLLHIPLIVASMMLYYWSVKHEVLPLYATKNPPMNLTQVNLAFDLPSVYLIWQGVVAILYFPCRWFGGLKQRSRAAWLSYL